MSSFKEGVHLGIPEDEYHSIVAASSSQLGKLKRSPAHMLAARTHPRETDAFLEGKLIHRAVLEPHLFTREGYVRGPEGDRRTKAVKDAWAELAEKHDPDKILAPKMFDMCHAVAMSIEIHPTVSAALVDMDPEVTIMWLDPETGVECKGRIDALPRSGAWTQAIVDVKSTKDASLGGFSHHYFRYGYYRQMAFYLQGLEVLGAWRPQAYIVAAEKYPPFALSLFRCDEGSLDAGYQENQVLLRQYARCLDTGVFPGYPESAQDLSIPTWAYAQVDDYITENTTP